MNQKPRIVCLTGNIAVGKSTLGQLLAQHFAGSVYIPEPHAENPFLPLFLKDKARWAFTAQLRYFADYVRVFRAGQHPLASRYFVDAGPWTNQHVYARYLAESGTLSAAEYAFYQELCNTLGQANHLPSPDYLILVSAAPRICLERMRRRGWAYQVNSIDLAYIEQLQPYFEQMAERLPVPCLSIDTDRLDFIAPDGQQALLSRVEGFFDGHERLNL